MYHSVYYVYINITGQATGVNCILGNRYLPRVTFSLQTRNIMPIQIPPPHKRRQKSTSYHENAHKSVWLKNIYIYIYKHFQLRSSWDQINCCCKALGEWTMTTAHSMRDCTEDSQLLVKSRFECPANINHPVPPPPSFFYLLLFSISSSFFLLVEQPTSKVLHLKRWLGLCAKQKKNQNERFRLWTLYLLDIQSDSNMCNRFYTDVI